MVVGAQFFDQSVHDDVFCSYEYGSDDIGS